MTHCPSCGRYVGPHDACPHCGAALGGRMPVRWLKVTALLLALGGLTLLWVVATRSEVPTVEIGQVTALMNMAYVHVEGSVNRLPAYDPNTGFLSFWLADETGELRVAVYRSESETLLRQAKMPGLGDRVTVKGTIRVREDYTSLTLNAPDHLRIERDEPENRLIGEITVSEAFKRVRVRGQVRSLRAPYSGLTLIRLRDHTGEIELAIGSVVTETSGALPAIAAGQGLEVIATVALYRDRPQLALTDVADLMVLDESPYSAEELSIAQIDDKQIGRWVAMHGKVIRVQPFSAGAKYIIEDETGQITLLMWQDIHNQLADPEALAPGATIYAQGEVHQYAGELEIIPELSLDIEVLALASAVQPVVSITAPEDLKIGHLSPERLGDTVTLQGYVRDATSFSQGYTFTLDDGSGQIALLTWLDVFDGIANNTGLRVGALIQVTGAITLYEGELQVTPFDGADVVLLETKLAPPPRREIGSLTLVDTSSWVTIQGQVVSTRTLSSGIRVILEDGSGQVMVPLWDSLLRQSLDETEVIHIPASGEQLRVTGRVDVFQETLEVVPVLPGNLEILPGPALDETRKNADISSIMLLGQIDANWIGKVITVTGRVTDTASFSQGFKFTLDDGSGLVVLVTWHDVFDTCDDASELNLGAEVRVRGKVGTFEEELQIVPEDGTAISVIRHPPAGSIVTTQPIQALGNQVGQLAAVTGDIIEAVATDSGARIVIRDDTGEGLIFIWKNVLDRVPKGGMLYIPGTQVRVTGWVQIYRGELELVPSLPYDIEVLE